MAGMVAGGPLLAHPAVFTGLLVVVAGTAAAVYGGRYKIRAWQRRRAYERRRRLNRPAPASHGPAWRTQHPPELVRR